MKIKAIHHIAIICSDYKRSKDFYVNKLGLPVSLEVYRKDRDSWKLDLLVGDKYQIEIFSFPGPPARVTRPEACGLRHLAFEVQNIEEAIEELKSAEIDCEAVRTDEFTGKKFTFFSDPDGLPLEIYEG
jgi:glyoxylase I family protein